MKLPKMGVNKNGVRNAMPHNPKDFFTFTAHLLVRVNILRFLLGKSFEPNEMSLSPKNNTADTLIIMPMVEHILTIIQFSLKAIPAIGPPTNFMVDANAMAIYVLNLLIIQ